MPIYFISKAKFMGRGESYEFEVNVPVLYSNHPQFIQLQTHNATAALYLEGSHARNWGWPFSSLWMEYKLAVRTTPNILLQYCQKQAIRTSSPSTRQSRERSNSNQTKNHKVVAFSRGISFGSLEWLVLRSSYLFTETLNTDCALECCDRVAKRRNQWDGVHTIGGGSCAVTIWCSIA